MTDTEYPKIETLFERNKTNFKVIADEDHLRLPEFNLVDKWHLTEKVDGTNIRIEYRPEGYVEDGAAVLTSEARMVVKGRTDNADIPPFLLDSINDHIKLENLAEAFDDDVVTTLYGEGYGAKIQKGGGNYRPDTSFRLFDVKVGRWWLNWENVEGIATRLGIKTVPTVGDDVTWQHALEILKWDLDESEVALEDSNNEGVVPEGLVARTNPLLFTRKGERLMWKIKHKDFA